MKFKNIIRGMGSIFEGLLTFNLFPPQKTKKFKPISYEEIRKETERMINRGKQQ